MLFLSESVHPYGSFWLDVADKAIKGAAVIVAGVWTLINFKRARTFQRKLEPKVSAEIFVVSAESFLRVTCRLKNVGQSKYPIRQKGTAIQIVPLKTTGRGEPIIAGVFEKHSWIEPGEEVEEPRIFTVGDPSEVIAYEVNLRVVSEEGDGVDAIEWNASSLASAYFSSSSNSNAQSGKSEPAAEPS